jgi:hypothetical protein
MTMQYGFSEEKFHRRSEPLGSHNHARRSAQSNHTGTTIPDTTIGKPHLKFPQSDSKINPQITKLRALPVGVLSHKKSCERFMRPQRSDASPPSAMNSSLRSNTPHRGLAERGRKSDEFRTYNSLFLSLKGQMRVKTSGSSCIRTESRSNRAS